MFSTVRKQNLDNSVYSKKQNKTTQRIFKNPGWFDSKQIASVQTKVRAIHSDQCSWTGSIYNQCIDAVNEFLHLCYNHILFVCVHGVLWEMRPRMQSLVSCLGCRLMKTYCHSCEDPAEGSPWSTLGSQPTGGFEEFGCNNFSRDVETEFGSVCRTF